MFNSYMDHLRKSRLNRTCFQWEQEEILAKSEFHKIVQSEVLGSELS